MTTIAYRDGWMVADSSATNGNEWMSGTATKLFRRDDGAVIGSSGDYCASIQLRDWFFSGMTGDGPGEGTRSLIALPNRDLIVLDDGKPAKINFVVPGAYAIGSGWPVAAAAMLAGADAYRAVEIVCQLDPYSRAPLCAMQVWCA